MIEESRVNTENHGAKLKQTWWKIVLIIVAILVTVLVYLVSPFLLGNGTVKYADIEDHFKYGSIGGERANGIPYWIWKVLPVVFADKLPGEGYTSLGFIQESDRDLPIGFSQSKILINRVGQNCATCHAGKLRDTPESKTQIITAMPSNTVDLEGYIQFLGEVAVDKRFTAREMMPFIEAMGPNFNLLEKLIYRYLVIPETRDALINIRSAFGFLERQSAYGPGRVDTFSSYKTRQFGFLPDSLEDKELNGVADFPSIWQQKA